MNCKQCGSPLTENDQFCKNCGATVNAYGQQINQSAAGINVSPAQPNVISSPVNPVGAMQQPMQNQPTMTNGYNGNPNFQASKNNSGFGKYIFIGLGILVAIVGVILVIKNIGGNNDSNSGSSSGIANTSNSTYSIKFDGFTFKIPTDLIYEADKDALYIGDEAGTWNVAIEVVSGSFSQLQSAKGQLISVYQQAGYGAANVNQKTYGGLDFITIEISQSGQNAILGFTKANSMYIFGTTAVNLNNEFDYDLLTDIAKILSTAEYSSESNNISVFNKFDMGLIDGLVK